MRTAAAMPDGTERHGVFLQHAQLAAAVFGVCVALVGGTATASVWLMSRYEDVGVESRAEVHKAFDQLADRLAADEHTQAAQAVQLATLGANLDAEHATLSKLSDNVNQLSGNINQLTGIVGDTNSSLKQLTQQVIDMNSPLGRHR